MNLAQRSFSQVIWLLLVTTPAFGLEGKVVQRGTGEPVVGAQVSILGRPGVVRTDAEGRFVWKPDPVPPFEVLVILTGDRYAKPVLVETLPNVGPLTIEVAPLVEESVTVSGTAPDIETTPASGMALLPSQEIQSRQPANLVQLLENVAGVSTVSEGQAAVPVIRGLARGRTLILIDGARVTSERRAGPSASYLDPFVLESVEVARGPGSVAYGSDALGGVIYARTRRVEPGAPLRMRFAGTGAAGTPEVRAAGEVSKGFVKGGILAQAHYRAFGDFRGPRGEIFNSGARDVGFLLRAENKLGSGLFAATWQSDFGRDVERPRDNSRIVRFFYPTEDSHRLTASYELNDVGGFSRIQTSGFFGGYTLVTDQDRFATPSQPRTVERGDVSAKDFQLRSSAERHVGPAKMELGVDVNGRFSLEALDINLSFDTTGHLVGQQENVSVDNARRTDTGVYITGETALARTLHAAAGVRGDYITTINEGGFFGSRSTSHGAGSGFASLTAGSYGGLSVSGQISRGFRDPVLSDRYFRGPTGRGFITGNPDLVPETSLQLDLAVRYTARRCRVAFYAFQYQIRNLIERFETQTDFFFFRNRGRARIRGIELESQADLGRGYSLQFAGQLTRGVARDDGAPLDDVPPESLSVQLRKQINSRAYAQLRGALHARDDQPGPTERVTPGYGLVDLSGGYTLNEHLQLQFLARNLFDATYLLSPDIRAVLAPGISGSITAILRF